MGQGRSWIAWLLAMGVFAGTVSAQGGKEGKPEDKVKEALAAFVKRYSEGEKKKDESIRVAAFDLLNGMLSDQRALDTVAKVLGLRSETDTVKYRAAQMLGESGNPKAIPILVKALDANLRNVGLAPAITRQLGSMNDASAVKELEKIVRPRVERFDNSDTVAIAQAGIQALGRLRFPESIDLLISLLGPIEAKGPGKGKHAGGPSEEGVEEQRASTEQALVDALKAVTAQELGACEEWKKWWAENRETWKPE